MTDRKGRFFYLDVLKFIAICMVTFCHFTKLGNTFLDNAFMTICFIAVPVFFMVNGALLFNKSFNLKKHMFKTLSLYGVATVWRILYLVDAVINNSVNIGACSKTQIITYIFTWKNITGCTPGHLWFMQALIAAYLIFPVLYFCFSSGDNGKKALVFAATAIFVTVFFVTDMNTLLLWMQKNFRINNAAVSGLVYFSPFGYFANMLAFFILGGLIHYKYIVSPGQEKPSAIHKKWRLISLGAFILSWFLMLFSKYIIDGTWLWNGLTYDSGYSRIPTLLASVAFFMLFLNAEINISVIRRGIILVASNTLAIYYIHWFVGRIVSKYIPYNHLFMNFSKMLLTLVISLLFGLLLSKIPIVKKIVK